MLSGGKNFEKMKFDSYQQLGTKEHFMQQKSLLRSVCLSLCARSNCKSNILQNTSDVGEEGSLKFGQCSTKERRKDLKIHVFDGISLRMAETYLCQFCFLCDIDELKLISYGENICARRHLCRKKKSELYVVIK